VALLTITLGFIVTSFSWWRTAGALEDADAERRRADHNLAEYERLADQFRLDELVAIARGPRLCPPVPAKVPAMVEWIERARALANGLPTLRKDVEALRATALPWSPAEQEKDRRSHEKEFAEINGLNDEETALDALIEEANASRSPRADLRLAEASERLLEIEDRREALERVAGRRLTFSFENPRERWRHDRLVSFIEGLEAFTAPVPTGPTIAAMQRRLSFARTVQAHTIDDHRDAWERARLQITGSALYPGLSDFPPQLGLVPLDPDPDSGMWEFAHLQSGTVPKRDPSTGRLLLTGDTGIVLVFLPGGTFTMGAQSDDPSAPQFDPHAVPPEGSPHDVTLQPFFLSKYEMTQGQWLRITGENPGGYRAVEDAPEPLLHPVEQVTWDECNRVMIQLGLALPTEAQWEYGCRGGTSTTWWTGDRRDLLEGATNLADQAAAAWGAQWTAIQDWPQLDDGYGFHAPVGSYRANAFGLHDVHGNVWEWCRDWFVTYDGRPPREGDGLRGIFPALTQIHRGGSFGLAAAMARSAHRSSAAPGFRDAGVGLRPSRALDR
jgi:formylglycine-generating enzyme required for sulfatase activity